MGFDAYSRFVRPSSVALLKAHKLQMRRVSDFINRGGSAKYTQEMSDEAVANAKKLALVATKKRRAELDKLEQAAGG